MPTENLNAGKLPLTFVATAETSANAVHLFLDGAEMNLRQNGDTWNGTKEVNAGDAMHVKFTVNGFEGTAWSLTLAIKCPRTSKKIVDESGTIGEPNGDDDENNGHGFEKDVDIPAEPCKAA